MRLVFSPRYFHKLDYNFAHKSTDSNKSETRFESSPCFENLKGSYSNYFVQENANYVSLVIFQEESMSMLEHLKEESNYTLT